MSVPSVERPVVRRDSDEAALIAYATTTEFIIPFAKETMA
jgi:hypothetical protein